MVDCFEVIAVLQNWSNNIIIYMKKLVITLLLVLPLILSAQDLVTYEIPKELFYSLHNDDYTVKVRKPGGEWKDLYEYKVRVDLDNVQEASMVTFDFTGKVEVSVRKNNGLVNSVQIRPLSYGIEPEVEGNVVVFTIDKPRKISLEVNGDKMHNLHIFANAILSDVPDPEDPDVIYFGPGVHKPKDLPGDVLHIPSGKTVFIDGGAVVMAKFLIDKAQDVKIIGHGVVLNPERGVEVRYSQNVLIDGPIFVNPSHYTVYGGQTTGLTIRNIKTFSCEGWSDGIDLMSCSDVVIDDVFVRSSDDCIALYGHRWQFYGNVSNCQIKNSVLWADIAHPTNIGGHGNAEAGGDTIENIEFKNIDILEHDEDDRNYQGCLAINSSDNNLVRNVTYEDIRIEDFQEGQLFNIRVVNNDKYSRAPGRGIENIVIKDVSYNGSAANPSIINGYSSSRLVKAIKIENLLINGKKVRNANDANVKIGDFVDDFQLDK